MNFRKSFFSLKITALILMLITSMLVLNVLIPQERVVGKKSIQEMTDSSVWKHLVLETLGLSRVPTSPPFLLLMALFFVHLVYYLFNYGSISLKRIRYAPRTWNGWKSMKIDLSRREQVKEELVRAGYRISSLEDPERSSWFVRNRISPLGFILFHVSFLALLLGGLLLYYTRFTARLNLALDQQVEIRDTGWTRIIRDSLIPPPSEAFQVALTDISARRERGEPVRLWTNLRFSAWSGTSDRSAEVNRPARFLGYTFIPQGFDETMILKIYDKEGFLLTTNAVMTRCLNGGRITVPIVDGCTLTISCEDGPRGKLICDEVIRAFPLVEGEKIEAGELVLHYVQKVPWISYLVIYERGGGILILGFVLAITGLIFRFVFPRQDLILCEGTLYFRGEYFPGHLKESISKYREVEP